METPPLRPEQFAHLLTGPPRAASEWVEASLAGDFRRAWSVMDFDLRLWLAQNWCYRNRAHPHLTQTDPQALARRFAANDTADHELWMPFTQGVGSLLADLVAGLGDDWVPSVTPRALGPDLELVIFVHPEAFPVDDNGQRYWPSDLPTRAFEVIMRHLPDGWRVASWGRHMPEPDWPPRWVPIRTGTEEPT